MVTNVAITAEVARGIATENAGRCVENLENVFLDITRASHCGCRSIIVKRLQHNDYRKLIELGFHIKPWHYNQHHVSWEK